MIRSSRSRRARTLLPFLPSLLFGVAGAIWVGVSPPDLPPAEGPASVALAAAGLASILLGAASLLERILPSFAHATRVLDAALSRLRLTPAAALLLAAGTAAGEELFFRGGMMQPLGVWGQALVFGALHPVSLRGWSYTVFTFLAGVLFGYSVLLTGSLWTAILAHFAINLHGLLSVRRSRTTPKRSP